jgi:hypothetical protein
LARVSLRLQLVVRSLARYRWLGSGALLARAAFPPRGCGEPIPVRSRALPPRIHAQDREHPPRRDPAVPRLLARDRDPCAPQDPENAVTE